MEVSDYPLVLTIGVDFHIKLFGEVLWPQSLSNQVLTCKGMCFYLVVAHLLLLFLWSLWILGNNVLYHKGVLSRGGLQSTFQLDFYFPLTLTSVHLLKSQLIAAFYECYFNSFLE